MDGVMMSVEEIKDLTGKLNEANEQVIELGNRINKAIEYINELKCNSDEECFNKLLDILKGEKNEINE